jgi:predicted HAD superfamily Cof-like phosphohydrolase
LHQDKGKTMSVFLDQMAFMLSCDQTVGKFNQDQLNMYLNLMQEEGGELADAIIKQDKVETLDALIDLIVVTIGAIHSLGVDADGAWREVLNSNLAKIDKDTGKVCKREDGKVLKPEGWTPPDLAKYVRP